MNKKLLAVAISSALAAPMAAQAIEASLSGHVNRAITFVDDGQASDWSSVDGMASQSRLRVVGSGDLGMGGMKVGTVMERGFTSNRSSGVTIKGRNGNTGGGDLNPNLRHSRLWFSGSWGKVTMGHGSGAYDGTAYFADQGGSVFLAGIENGTATHAGGVAFRTGGGATARGAAPGTFSGTFGAGNTVTTTANAGAAITVGGAFQTYDGGRYDNIRYDSPKLGPVSVAVDLGDNQRWSIAATLSTKFSGASVKAKIGYEDVENDSTTGVEDNWGLSAGVLFSQGTNITVAYAERGRANGGRDSDNFYVKLGHRWGPEMVNSVAIDYIQTDDHTAAGSEASSWGIGFAHDIPGPKVNLYAGYRNWDLDIQGANLQDVDGFNMGARVRF